jgi:hypothetical protein
MRVYVGTTFEGLRALRDNRGLPSGARGVAVTPAFRESWASGDDEELEYAAMAAAAEHSLALIRSGAGGRRVVLACDVPEASETGSAPGEVVVPGDIPLRDVTAVHVDDPAVDLADAEGWELMWYATQEIEDLLR